MRRSVLSLSLAATAACGPKPEYMEAMVDGVLWQAERAICLFHDGELEVHGHRATGSNTRRAIEVSYLATSTVGSFLLAEEGPRGFVLDQDAVGWDTYVGYATTATVTGTVTVATFDLGAGRCGGAFAFTAVMVHNLHGDVVPDTIEVVDGTWDAELHAY